MQQFEATGSPVMTDGEHRKQSFVSYPLHGLPNLAAIISASALSLLYPRVLIVIVLFLLILFGPGKLALHGRRLGGSYRSRPNRTTPGTLSNSGGGRPAP